MASPLDITDCVYTVLSLPDELLGLSHSFLGDGEFGFIAPVCKRFKSTYLNRVSDKKITSVESATSSISRTRAYLEYAGGGVFRSARRFWYCVARYGRVGVMEWAHQRGHSRDWNHKSVLSNMFSLELTQRAAKYGQLGALQWFRQNGCKLENGTCYYAARGGHLSVLQWARANGCRWDRNTCTTAAEGGHLSVLRWARANGCQWDSDTCRVAARGGHLSVLQWARVHGCEWDSSTCSAAAEGGHLSVLQWTRENGCDWEWDTYRAAQICGNQDVLNYVIAEGCPRFPYYPE